MSSESSTPTTPLGVTDAPLGIPLDLEDATAENIQRRAGRTSTPDLKEVLSEARRRQSPGLSDARRNHLAAFLAIIAQELADREVTERSRRVEDTERRQPLRRRILDLLLDAPRSPTDLATALGVAKESVSRALRELSKDGLVSSESDPDDARVKVYSAVNVTAAGRAAVAEYRAFGAPGTPPEALGDEEVRDHLVELVVAAEEDLARGDLETARIRSETIEREAGDRKWSDLVDRARTLGARAADQLVDAREQLVRDIDRAVELRRTGSRSTAIPMLAATCGLAVANGWLRIELRARAELMASLRQADRQADLDRQFETLSELRFGPRPVPGVITQIAAAHEFYERGRRPSADGSEGPSYESLVAAQAYYTDLADHEPDEPEWAKRRGWASLSIAENLRRQTYHGRALRHVKAARDVFDQNDSYGLARTLFVEGFCMKLQGKFDAARAPLAEALELVEARGYRDFEADIRAQLGDVERCTNQLDVAELHLRAAKTLGITLGRPVTSAFAVSALGAVAYAHGDYPTAISLFETSEDSFSQAGHAGGKALTKRRLATAIREQDPERVDGAGRSSHALYREALEIYGEMGSPAGAAACLIGEIRLHLELETDHESAAQLLAALVEADRAHSLLLRLDPYVPALIHDLAATMGDDPLVDLSQELNDAAAVHAARRGVDAPPLKEGAEAAGLEMACEPRRDADEPTWVAELADMPALATV